MRLFLTGDTHGGLSAAKLSETNWPEQKKLCRDDLLVILGDFGFIWSNEPNRIESYWLKVFNEVNYRLAFVDGNHENHDRLAELDEVEFQGGIAGKVCENVWHLKRGEIYRMGEKDIFVMGGADSIDKFMRNPGTSWWENEIPSPEEMEHGFQNLERNNNRVDYIFTHTLPSKLTSRLKTRYSKGKDPTAIFLDIVNQRTSFDRWFAAHFHEDFVHENFQVLYHQIIEVDLKLPDNH